MSDPLHCGRCGETYYNDEGHDCREEQEAIHTGTSSHEDVTGGYDSGRHNH